MSGWVRSGDRAALGRRIPTIVGQPVFRMPAAMPLTVSSRARARSGSGGSPGHARASARAARPAGSAAAPGRRRAPAASGAARDWRRAAPAPVTRSTSATVRSCSARIVSKGRCSSGGTSVDVVVGELEVGLHERHRDVREEVAEEAPLVVHLAQRRPARPRARRRARSRRPNQPGTIWRDCVQPKTQGIARRPSIPPPESGRREGASRGGARPAARPGSRRGSRRAARGRRPVRGSARRPPSETRPSPPTSAPGRRRRARAPVQDRRFDAAPSLSSRLSRASSAAGTCRRSPRPAR